MTSAQKSETAPTLFLPSRRAAIALVVVGIASLGIALFFRYGLVQNTPLGLACEEDGASFICAIRLAVILMFTFSIFGWLSVIVSLIQLWRPHVVLFGIGLAVSMLGIVLYNTRAAALAAVLLLLSLARPAPAARRR